MSQEIKTHTFEDVQHQVVITYGDKYVGLSEGKSVYTVIAYEYAGHYADTPDEDPQHHYYGVSSEYFENESDALAAFNIRTQSLDHAFKTSGLPQYRW